MENGKALIIFTAIGPTFRARVVSNIQDHKSLEYFDILVVTDLVEDFECVKRANVFVRDINALRDEWSKENEIMPPITKDAAEYAKKIQDSRLQYPYSVQRFCFKFENIEKYSTIFMLDCDIEVRYNEDTLNNFNTFLKPLSGNVVIGHGVYDYSQNPHIKEATINYCKQLGISLGNYETGFLLNDGPVRIYRFTNGNDLRLFFKCYDFIVRDLYTKKDTPLILGSWNILAEPILAIVYKIVGVQVICRGDDSFTGQNILRCRSFPEDRFWNDFPGWSFNTEQTSKEDYIKVNYDKLKQFYAQHNPELKWPY